MSGLQMLGMLPEKVSPMEAARMFEESEEERGQTRKLEHDGGLNYGQFRRKFNRLLRKVHQQVLVGALY